MADHIYNKAGSTSVTPPSAIAVGDTLTFNITNLVDETKYKGTLLTYTFPFDCKVKMEVAGARGGEGNRATQKETGSGAVVTGTRVCKKGETLLMLVGQAGTDASSSLNDGIGGAGGGGTFVTLKVDTGGDKYTGEGVGNGWLVTPLIVSAGGAGSVDVGFKGSHPAIHGSGQSRDFVDYLGKLYNGGGYSLGYSQDEVYNGATFLLGGFGATNTSVKREQLSVAGFGGGGAFQDDYRAGAGGYYGGVRKPTFNNDFGMEASSYVDTEMTEVTRKDGANYGEGYVKFTFLEVSEPKPPKPPSEVYAKMDDVWVQVI